MQVGNQITIHNQESLDNFIEGIKQYYDKNKFARITIDSRKQRTKNQNNAMHLYFSMVSDELINAGIDTKAFFKEGYTLPFSSHIVKTELWKPLMLALTDKTSTAELDKNEVSSIYEHLNNKLAEHGLHVPFPSIEAKR